jgi:hypothetical protein
MCPLLAQLKIGFFSSLSAAAVYSTNEANKAGPKQSTIFRCLWFGNTYLVLIQFLRSFFGNLILQKMEDSFPGLEKTRIF